MLNKHRRRSLHHNVRSKSEPSYKSRDRTLICYRILFRTSQLQFDTDLHHHHHLPCRPYFMRFRRRQHGQNVLSASKLHTLTNSSSLSAHCTEFSSYDNQRYSCFHQKQATTNLRQARRFIFEDHLGSCKCHDVSYHTLMQYCPMDD